MAELASPSDEGPSGLNRLRRKMAACQRDGARLGWLLMPTERAVELWGPLAECDLALTTHGLHSHRLRQPAAQLDGALIQESAEALGQCLLLAVKLV